jgi:uncharacterized RDD family membrane protein YckC
LELSVSEKPLHLTSAPIWRRLAALLYDSFALIAIVFVGTGTILLFRHNHAIPSGHLGYRIFLLALVAAYYAWSWSVGGQTLGMRAWRLHLVDAENGKFLSARRIVIRLAAAASGIALAGIGLWWCFFDPGRQALYDKLAGSRLVFQKPF